MQEAGGPESAAEREGERGEETLKVLVALKLRHGPSLALACVRTLRLPTAFSDNVQRSVEM